MNALHAFSEGRGWGLDEPGFCPATAVLASERHDGCGGNLPPSAKDAAGDTPICQPRPQSREESVSQARLIVALASIAVISSCSHSAAVTTTAATPATTLSAAPAAAVDTLPAFRQRAVTAQLQPIAGPASAPAERGFPNLTALKGAPAPRFSHIMRDT